MIGKVTHGRNIDRLLSYICDKEGAYILDKNTVNEVPSLMAKEFRAIAALRPTVKRNVWHATLSTGVDEPLSDAMWKEIAREYMNKMGLSDNQYVVCRHTDTEHHHIHIAVNRIAIKSGEPASDQFSIDRTLDAVREIEEKFHLKKVDSQTYPEVRALKTGEVRRQRRTGEKPARKKIQEDIDDIYPGCTSTEEFKERLAEKNINVRYRRDNGIITGVSFGYGELHFRGSQLGRRYSWTNLSEQFEANRTRGKGLSEVKDELQSRYQALSMHIPSSLTQGQKDTLIARALVEGGLGEHEVKGVIAQSPAIEKIKSNGEKYQPTAIAYINSVYHQAKAQLVNVTKVV